MKGHFFFYINYFFREKKEIAKKNREYKYIRVPPKKITNFLDNKK